MKIERLCVRPYFNFPALCARDNGTVREHKNRPLYGHFWPLRAVFVLYVLICVALYAPSDQMIREVMGVGMAAGIPGVAAGALDSEHKKKPRRAAGIPGPAGLLFYSTSFPLMIHSFIGSPSIVFSSSSSGLFSTPK